VPVIVVVDDRELVGGPEPVNTDGAAPVCVHNDHSGVYTSCMNVAVTDLRAHLSEWLDRVRAGDEVVITDRGIPVARLLGMTATSTLQRLAAEGVIGHASAQRPASSGRWRPRPRHPVSGIVSEQRR
jgi:prevent-host-death family protein